MSTTRPSGTHRWAARFRYLSLTMLVFGSAVALATGPATGATSPGWRLGAQLATMVATAALVGWWTVVGPPPSEAGARGRWHYAVRTVLALLLTLLNPLFCIFAWVGFVDAYDYFRRRGATVAIGLTAVTMALGQSGGVPWSGPAQAALFGVLVLVNFGLAAALGHYASDIESTSEERAVAISELERVNAALEEALAENATLHETVVAQARTAGVQEERQRLAREIHDGIAQSLAAVLTQLRAATDEEDPRRRIARAGELAQQTLTEARRSMLDLSPTALTSDGLADAVEGVVAAWDTDHAPEAHVVVTGDSRPLHPEVEATVLRIAQEALANVAKHAAAQRVGVTLSFEDDEIILDVRDNGVGFAVGHPTGPTSFGLRGMEQRAERLAGVLEVESAPGEGTAVSLRLPALERAAA